MKTNTFASCAVVIIFLWFSEEAFSELTTDIPPTTFSHRSYRKYRPRKNKTISIAAEVLIAPVQAEVLEAGVRRLAAALEHPQLVLEHLRNEEENSKSTSLTTARTISPTLTSASITTSTSKRTPITSDELTSTSIESEITTTELSTEIPDNSESNHVTLHVEPSFFDNKSEASPRKRKSSHSTRRRSRMRQSKNRTSRITKLRREPSPFLLPPYANTFSDYRRPHYRPKPTPIPIPVGRPIAIVDAEEEKRFFEPLIQKTTIQHTNADRDKEEKFVKENLKRIEQSQHYQEQGHFNPSGEFLTPNQKKLEVHHEALAHFASIINITTSTETSSPTDDSEDELQMVAEDRHYRKQSDEERQMIMNTRRRLESQSMNTESGEQELVSYRRFLKEHEAQLRLEKERLEAEERRELWERIRRREEERRLAAEEAQRKKVNQMLENMNRMAENRTYLMDQVFNSEIYKPDNDWPIATTFQPRGFMLPHEINHELDPTTTTKRPLIISPRKRPPLSVRRQIRKKIKTKSDHLKNDDEFNLTSAETAYYKKRQLTRMRTLVRKLDGPGSIPGIPGRDYPIYNSPPVSSFSCTKHQGRQGYVADISTKCQVFYICSEDGHGEPVLCPNGTVFNQDVLVCDWWFNVNCQG